MNRKKTVIMLEIAIAAAMAIILSKVRLYKMPYGGSVTLELFPLVFISYRRGVKAGLFTGTIHTILSLIFPETPHISYLQPVLDYFLPSVAMAFCGFGHRKGLYVKEFLFVISIVFNFLSHFTAGFVYYGQYASAGQSKYVYSAIYNSTYLIPSGLAIAFIILIFERKKLFEYRA